MKQTSIELSKGLVKYFNITNYIKANTGGQKTVFIVTIEDQKML